MEVIRGALAHLPRVALAAGGATHRREVGGVGAAMGGEESRRELAPPHRPADALPPRPPPPARTLHARTCRYADVLAAALHTCQQLHGAAAAPAAAAATNGSTSNGTAAAVDGPRIALMCDPGPGYVAGMLGAWLRGGVAVPLCLAHPDR